MKLNEYGIFEYSKNGHSLGALLPDRSVRERARWMAVTSHGKNMERDKGVPITFKSC